MYCSNCGKKLSADDYFCSSCGTPVLRQGLFNDDDAVSADDFEETRLFTAEELGRYLEEDEERSKLYEVQAPADVRAAKDTDNELKASVVNKNVDKDGINAHSTPAVSAFADKLKNKIDEIKSKQTPKKETQENVSAEDVVQSVNEEPVIYSESTYAEMYDADERQSKDVVSIKKIILPVVLLGLIIGLVIGLMIVQPWSNSDDNEEQTATGVVMMLEE